MQHPLSPDHRPARSPRDNLQELTRRVKTHGGGPFRIKLSTQTASVVSVEGKDQTSFKQETIREQWLESLRLNPRITSVDVRVEPYLNRRRRHHHHRNNNNNPQHQQQRQGQLPPPPPEEDLDLIRDMYQLLEDLGTLPNLTELKISGYCYAFPLDILTSLLRKATNLVVLAMTSVKFSAAGTTTRSSITELADAIACHESLMDWKLLDCQFVPHQETTGGDQQQLFSSSSSSSSYFFLDTILINGVARSSTLESLSLTPTRPNAMGSISNDAIQSFASLKSLKLGSIGTWFLPTTTTTTNRKSADNHYCRESYHTCTTITPFETFMQLLASNKTNLRYIHIPFYANQRNCKATTNMILHNTTLQELALRTYHNHHHHDMSTAVEEEGSAVTTMPDEYYKSLSRIARALAVNTTLVDFELLGPMRLRDPALLREFATVLQVNYTLHDLVLFELVMHPQHNPTMTYQAKLNQYGRKQWLEDLYRNNNNNNNNNDHRDNNSGGCNKSQSRSSISSSKDQQQVAFLEKLARDPDVLYYYLSRMNPSFLESLMMVSA